MYCLVYGAIHYYLHPEHDAASVLQCGDGVLLVMCCFMLIIFICLFIYLAEHIFWCSYVLWPKYIWAWMLILVKIGFHLVQRFFRS